MLSTWIESASKGRHGGPVRAGMWSAVVVGTHPIEADQEVWLELLADDLELGPLPAYWIENKGVNSVWHVPIPPQGVGVRLRYRAGARRRGSEPVYSPHQDTIVRPNLPDRTEGPAITLDFPEGLVGNRMMTARVDSRGSTYDVYFPTVGLHSDVRPAEGDLPQSRSHFRAIVGGLAVGRRLDWFSERRRWEVFQHYLGATNLLVTELRWRNGPIRVWATDFVAMGPDLPRTAAGSESPGQYIKRFRVFNEGDEPRRALFGIFAHTEINGGIGEPGLSWLDGDRTLLASNRGHSHGNRKLARDATVEFALALDDRGSVRCEPTGPDEAMLLRWLDLPAGGSVTVDLLVSGAFTGWRGDMGTFEHWLRPALAWFRAADLDQVEQRTAQQWDTFVEPLPELLFPRPTCAVSLRRSALAAALHADAKWGAIAAGFDRGLSAYCWPRDAVAVGACFDRLGHAPLGRAVYEWLARTRNKNRPYAYWFQKYTIDGWPEWETPAIDQTAVIPWGLERHYRRTGDLDFVTACWPMIEQAAGVCSGASGHPGLRWLDDLSLITSAGIWDDSYGAFLYSNTAVVAGLRAAARLATVLDRGEFAGRWNALADRIWEAGILGTSTSDGEPRGFGLVDPETGRFLNARRLSTLPGLWCDRPEHLVERSADLDVALLGPTVPFQLLPASDPRVLRGAEALLKSTQVPGDPNLLARWARDPARPQPQSASSAIDRQQDASTLATLWMARYLIALGRDTGDARHWSRAVTLLESIIGRLGPLALLLRLGSRRAEDPGSGTGMVVTSSLWGLHAQLIDALLDLAGLDYDAVDRRLTLEPVLPPGWPHVGMIQPLACGRVEYRLERNGTASRYHLNLTTRLNHPVDLTVRITCPGLNELGPWQAQPPTPPPAVDAARGLASWSLPLPEGESHFDWSWG